MSSSQINKLINRRRPMTMPMLLIAINIAVFAIVRAVAIVDAAAGRSIDPLLDRLSLSADFTLLLSHPWTVVSYMWVQYDPLHLLFNMIALWFFGRILSQRLGGRAIFLLYILCGVAGGVAFITAAQIAPSVGGMIVGSSGAVTGLLVATAVMMPSYKVSFQPVVSIKLKWIAAAAVGVFAVGLTGSNVSAHVCHLGGMTAGAVAAIIMRRGFNLSRQRSKTSAETVDDTPVDSILAKVRLSGFSSLTPSERQRLFKK